jgi:phytoene dehydrogenase-like protein
VVLAGLSPEAAARVVGRAPFEAGPPAAAACLDLGVTGSAPRGASIGMDEPLYLSRHAPPAALAPAGHAVVHVARYLTPEDTADPAAARAELERFATRAGITDEMVVASRYLHRMTVVHAIPTPALGGLPGRPGVDATGVPGVFLAGDWVGPRGHLLDAALASVRAAAEAVSTRLERSMMSVR